MSNRCKVHAYKGGTQMKCKSDIEHELWMMKLLMHLPGLTQIWIDTMGKENSLEKCDLIEETICSAGNSSC